MDAKTFSLVAGVVFAVVSLFHLCSGITVPPGPDFCGVDAHHRRLVSADMGELGGFHRRWWARPSRLGTEMGAREGRGGVF